MRRLGAIFAGALAVLAIAAPGALAEATIEPWTPTGEGAAGENGTAASQTEAPAPAPTVKQGDSLAAPEPSPAPKQSNGGGITAKPEAGSTPQAAEEAEGENGAKEA
ncbi:MAG TPA: hypothetical protein VIM28_07415, partial [Solirubrobacterales bacterium]